jgi:hypothetical protein
LEREKTKYWARLLLIFPLCPVIVALTTIVFGGVVINVASTTCNSKLLGKCGYVVLVFVWYSPVVA